MKDKKGITLVALVVTIIVLLILAGVSISMVTGDNGIVAKAKKSVEKTNAANADEEQKLKDAEYYIDEKVNGTSFLNGKLASQINVSNYGDYVNYGVDLGITLAGKTLADGKVPKTDWRIFYKDSTNVYLIASDYLPVSKFPNGVFGDNNGDYNGYWLASDGVLITSGTVTSNTKFLFNKLSNVTKSNLNYQAVSTLLDTSKWSPFAKEGYVDDVNTAVIGSPTVEMWMASWNERYNDTLSFDANTTGYQVGLNEESLSEYIIASDMQSKEGFNNTLYYPHASTSSSWNNCNGYWLASPSAKIEDDVMNIYYNGGVYLNKYVGSSSFSYAFDFGVRPVVSLKSDILASKEGDVWQLEN